MEVANTSLDQFANAAENGVAKKIYGFYHVCCIGQWKTIVKQQVENIVSSPLYLEISKVFVCIIASEEQSADLSFCHCLFPEKFEIVIVSTNIKEYEFPILKFLKQKSMQEDFYCFYFHAKGVSINDRKIGVCYWRREMEFFLFHKHEMALKAFNQGYNTYGANLRAEPLWKNNIHFSGNFWFAKSSYIALLPDIPDDLDNRYYAEEWIGKSNEIKPFTPYNTFFDLYYTPLPRLFYDRTLPVKFKDIIELKLFLFGYLRNGILNKLGIAR